MGEDLDQSSTPAPPTPARITAYYADLRVRARTRAACARGAVAAEGIADAVVFAVRLDGASSLSDPRSHMVGRVAGILGRAPSDFECGLIAGLALAIATEGA